MGPRVCGGVNVVAVMLNISGITVFPSATELRPLDWNAPSEREVLIVVRFICACYFRVQREGVTKGL
jgi:hypothetical protein